MLTRVFRSLVFTLLFLSPSAGAHAQFSEDIRWLTDLVNNAQPKTLDDRTNLFDQIIQRLGPHASSDGDVRALIRTIEVANELLRFEAESLAGSTNSAVNAKTAAERAQKLESVRAAVLDRAATLIEMLAHPNISVQDAKRISEIAKYASQALDDIKDPTILGGASSAYTKLLTQLNGVASLASAVQDPQAKSILSGLRGTLGTIDRKLKDLGVSAGNPMKAFDIPAEVAGAMVSTSRQGMDEASAALTDIGKAIGGDSDALKRLPGHSQRIEHTLSPSNYGKAMFKAITDRVIDRIPFVRTLEKLFGEPTPNVPEPRVGSSGKAASLDWWVVGSASFLNEDDVYSCGPNPGRKGLSSLDGTHRYMTASAVCMSAVHSGAITFEKGGRFQLRFFPYDPNFSPRASTLNGVTSSDYGWSSLKLGSFVIIKVEEQQQ